MVLTSHCYSRHKWDSGSVRIVYMLALVNVQTVLAFRAINLSVELTIM